MIAWCYTNTKPQGFPVDLTEWPNQVREPVLADKEYIGPCPCCEKKIVMKRHRTTELSAEAKEFLNA